MPNDEENEMNIILTPREETIYKLRNDGMVYRLIGEQFGITGERARQIYCKAVRKINRSKGKEKNETI